MSSWSSAARSSSAATSSTRRSRAATRSRSTRAACTAPARRASSTSPATAPTSRRCTGRALGRRDRHVAATSPAHVEAVGARSTSATTCSSRPATSIPTGPTSRSTRTRRRGRTARATARTRPPPSGVLPRAGGAVVRAGLIVGPHDNVFRLPWWVRRIARGRRRPRARPPRPRAADHRRARPGGLPARPGRAARPPAPSTAPRRSGRRRWRSCCAAAGRRRAALDPRRASSRRPDVEPWMELPLWLPGALRGHLARRHREGAGGRAADPPGRARPSDDIRNVAGKRRRSASWTTGASEHRPAKMSAEREAALFRLLC